ncbi:hypothetical protein WJX74_007313 [Apatococcus lobatus]|uniref:2-hydroxy-3-oxopropionate reductase n=1 Tax=Apatococcus lobatus TaxID=904363 RepID=A0AAW1QYM0_9CHLO
MVSASTTGIAKPKETQVGFVGIGIMGLAMANNLLKEGYEVLVWNRSPDRCNALREAGARVLGSAAEVAQQSDITIGMLADPAAALDVALGEKGVVAGLSAGKGYVDASTVDAGTAKKISEAVKATGADYLEAPVSGSKQPAEQGTLIFLTGGDEALFNRAGPLLDVMGKAKFFLGDVGAGANMKLAVNLTMGDMMVAFAEGMALAKVSGLSADDFTKVVGLGALAAPMFGLKGPSMAKEQYPTAFPLKHQQKDLRLALELAAEHRQTLPLTSTANDLYLQAQKAGRGDDDFSGVMAAVLAGSTTSQEAKAIT